MASYRSSGARKGYRRSSYYDYKAKSKKRSVKRKGESQRVSLRSSPDKVPFWNEPERAPFSYFRVPVSQAIPNQQIPGCWPDEQWRVGNKVVVTGVCVRMKLYFATSVAVMGVCYPAKVQQTAIGLNAGIPAQFALGVKDGTMARLMNLEETRLVDGGGNGPFALVPGAIDKDGTGDPQLLDSSDQTLFGCRLSKGPGAPVGVVRWKPKDDKTVPVKEGRTYKEEFHISPVMRTQFGVQTDRTGGGEYVQYDSRDLEVYFELNEEVEFVRAEGNVPVFNPHFEVLMGVRALTRITPVDGQHGVGPVECGSVENVLVDVYYRSPSRV